MNRSYALSHWLNFGLPTNRWHSLACESWSFFQDRFSAPFDREKVKLLFLDGQMFLRPCSVPYVGRRIVQVLQNSVEFPRTVGGQFAESVHAEGRDLSWPIHANRSRYSQGKTKGQQLKGKIVS